MTEYLVTCDRKSINTSKLTKWKLSRILGSKQYYLFFCFLGSLVEYSVIFFIQSSGFGLLDQLVLNWPSLLFESEKSYNCLFLRRLCNSDVFNSEGWNTKERCLKLCYLDLHLKSWCLNKFLQVVNNNLERLVLTNVKYQWLFE